MPSVIQSATIRPAGSRWESAASFTNGATTTLFGPSVTPPLVGIVLRYGNFYGPGASDAMVEIVRKRMLPIVGDGAGVTSWIHVDDAAAATVAALERGERGIYNIVDDEPTRAADWVPAMAEAVGAKPPRRFRRGSGGCSAARWWYE